MSFDGCIRFVLAEYPESYFVNMPSHFCFFLVPRGTPGELKIDKKSICSPIRVLSGARWGAGGGIVLIFGRFHVDFSIKFRQILDEFCGTVFTDFGSI